MLGPPSDSTPIPQKSARSLDSASGTSDTEDVTLHGSARVRENPPDLSPILTRGMMRKDGGGRHSQNYDTCIALCAVPLHAENAPGAAVLHTEMMPLRMAYWTSSAVVRSPRAFRMRALWASPVRMQIFSP